MRFDIYVKTRYKVLQSLIYISTIIYSVFLGLNLIRDKYTLSFLEFVICIINITLLFKFNDILKSKYIKNFTLIYTCSLLTAMMMTFHHVHSDFTYIWVLLIPFGGYINGIKTGFWITAVFSIISLGIYASKNSFYQSANMSQYLNIFLGLITIWMLTHIYEKSKYKMIEKLLSLTTIDPLTNLKNRTQLYTVYSKYKNNMMCLILLDIDQLKNINNSYGHLAGDVVLLEIAQVITKRRDHKSYAFRIGDDEFAILTPESDSEDCLEIAKTLFAKITDCQTVFKNDIINVRVSMSISHIKSDGNNLDALMQKANHLLQQAKRSETDKIVL